ncbi:DNA polymerase III subunit chi [Candidatus Pandoraea novymonadis]|uniref:DNA polymerase III subunit chi n=1 Tax=Candidatus Pandoraea novymonadis TaxID=1808959 RepID=A0ABX5FF10_9BURK|nr:DNA polymerase III subunit chi [Candidatus Pandoraea novymonadis]PSB92246.1 hypothetical protein BZL35_00481 [Candidatus Pandoraea novymonadis]
MTRVDFYIHPAKSLDYACRLARKVYVSGHTLVVVAERPLLEKFDYALWTFGAMEFVPHCRSDDLLAERTPVLLAGLDDEVPHYYEGVLLNLASSVPTYFACFERVLEVVSDVPDQLASARARYRFYRDRGYAIKNHDQRERNSFGI